MRFSLSDFRRIVTNIVQPLARAEFVQKIGLTATLKDQPPIGQHDRYVDTQPFGLSSNPTPGTFGYILNFGGSRLSPIVIAQQHNKRPLGAQGETIIYSTDITGKTVKSKTEYKVDGTLIHTSVGGATITMTPAGKITVKSLSGKQIELTSTGKITIGSSTSSEPLVLGTAFTTLYNAHTHIGNAGIPTGVPIIPMAATEISGIAFTEI